MSLGLRPVDEWVKAHLSVCLGECPCEWMCAHPCVGVSGPPIPLSDGQQLEAILLQLLANRMTMNPQAQQGSHTATAWGQASFLAKETKAPFSTGARREGRGRVDWKEAQEWLPSGALCHLCLLLHSPLHSPLCPLSASGCIALATPGNWKLIFQDH